MTWPARMCWPRKSRCSRTRPPRSATRRSGTAARSAVRWRTPTPRRTCRPYCWPWTRCSSRGAATARGRSRPGSSSSRCSRPRWSPVSCSPRSGCPSLRPAAGRSRSSPSGRSTGRSSASRCRAATWPSSTWARPRCGPLGWSRRWRPAPARPTPPRTPRREPALPPISGQAPPTGSTWPGSSPAAPFKKPFYPNGPGFLSPVIPQTNCSNGSGCATRMSTTCHKLRNAGNRG